MEITRLFRQRTVDAVHEILRETILAGKFRPGEKLDLEDLAARFGVSLAPVRNALHDLVSEGLVEVKSRSGAFVSRPSARDIEETFDIRLALECLAAGPAAQHITSPQLRTLQRIFNSLSRPVRTASERRAHDAANAEFHRRIVEASGNRRLLEIYSSLNGHLRIARIHAGDPDWPSRISLEQQEHAAICSALQARNATALKQALRKHITRAKRILLQRLGDALPHGIAVV